MPKPRRASLVRPIRANDPPKERDEDPRDDRRRLDGDGLRRFAGIEHHVIGAEPIPVEACLSRLGLEVEVADGPLQITRPADLAADQAAMLAGMLGAP